MSAHALHARSAPTVQTAIMHNKASHESAWTNMTTLRMHRLDTRPRQDVGLDLLFSLLFSFSVLGHLL
jgi:hypothetical protein